MGGSGRPRSVASAAPAAHCQAPVMDRSRAEPRAQAALPRCRTAPARLFAIFCSIILIIITESPASGFAIPHANITRVFTRDLSAEESTLLEVKYDIKRPNDLRESNDSSVNKTDVSSIDSATDDNFKRRAIYNPDFSHETSTFRKQFDDQIVYSKLIDKSTRTITLRKENRLNDENTISASPFKGNEEGSGKSTELLENPGGSINHEDLQTTTISQKDTASEKIYDRGELSRVSEAIISTSMSTHPEILAVTEGHEIIDKLKARGNDNKEFSSTYPLLTELLRSTDTQSVAKLSDEYTVGSFNESEFGKDEQSLASSEKAASTTTVNDVPSSLSGTNIDGMSVILFSTGANKSIDVTDTTPLITSTQTQHVQLLNPTSYVLSSALYKTETSSTAMEQQTFGNYTNIEMKPNTTRDFNLALTSTASDNNRLNVDTMRTRISLEDVTATPISSLEQLRQDLISAISQRSSQTSTGTETVQPPQSTGYAEVIDTSTYTLIPSTNFDERDMVSSKRAGFLDLTVKTVASDEMTTSGAITTETNVMKETDGYVALYEVELPEADGIENKTPRGSESQSQLAEDAIKEELLKEEQLINHAENAKRYRDENIGEIDGVRPLAAVSRRGDPVVLPATEDSLSVKPINHDKIKNTSLYTVSPNYKPMKKIDVQAPKQFVRDPDDNSWRNESISSLGIVFKPKNSSKSFKQVLKNKTEIELSNLLDRNKSDVPDLRVRLEKIAEVRKSKKKNIDKFGETVYTDYEESGEGSTSSTTYVPSSTTSIPFSTLNTTTDNPNQYITVSTIAENKQTDAGTLTTNKPKKFFNIAEYYDTGDEYDAEYAKISKIDIKKNPKPVIDKVIVTTPVEFPQTKLTPMPVRKPTVQYFPPRVHQKVNVNDYDDNFQRKINFYASKDNSKYGDIPSGAVPTIQTPRDKLEQADKEYTVRPLELTPAYHAMDINRNLYYTGPPRASEPAVKAKNYNKGSYVIKHFREYLDEPTKDSDDDRNSEYHYTEPPARGVTVNELAKARTPDDDDYEYDNQFRKDILNRFVDNFNQNSERFKVDFPVVYNSSVVHRQAGAAPALSSALMKRLYDDAAARLNTHLAAVDLAPAYELHYYVPDQEERQERQEPDHAEPRPPAARLEASGRSALGV